MNGAEKMAKKIDKFREAICQNRGGHENASDEKIMLIWKSLDPDVQKQYLESVKTKGKDNANSMR